MKGGDLDEGLPLRLHLDAEIREDPVELSPPVQSDPSNEIDDGVAQGGFPPERREMSGETTRGTNPVST
jgi:hypothetical protein